MNQPASNYVPSGADIFNNVVNKAKSILLKPAEAWQHIKAEHESVSDFYKSYMVYMAAIGPVCTLVGGLLASETFSFSATLMMSVFAFVTALAMPAIMGFVVTKIAPMCGGSISFDNGVRYVGYAATATYVAGLLNIIPFMAILSILFLAYAIYTLYLGAPVMAGIADDQKIKFTAITMVAWLVVSILFSIVLIPIFIGSSLATTAVS